MCYYAKVTIFFDNLNHTIMLHSTHLQFGVQSGIFKLDNEPWDEYKKKLFFHTYNSGEPIHAVTIFFNLEHENKMDKHHKAFFAQAEAAHMEDGMEGLKKFVNEYITQN